MIKFTGAPQSWRLSWKLGTLHVSSWWLCGILLVAMPALQQYQQALALNTAGQQENKQSLDNAELEGEKLLARDSKQHWQLQPSSGAATGDLLNAPTRHKLATSDDEPIVMKSVHSGSSLLKHPLPTGLHWPSRVQPPQVPELPPLDSSQEVRHSITSELSHLVMLTPQPSQEFDSAGAAQQKGQQETIRPPNWSSPNPPLKTPVSGLRAPYTAAGSGAPYVQTNSIQSWNQNTEPPRHQHLSSLIRDTSELQREMISHLEHSINNAGHEHQQVTHQQSTWMQSVRDNHNGPLRSRFNLSSTSHESPSSWDTRNRFPAAGFGLLSFGNGRSDTPNDIPNDPNSWSRRNSKLTRPDQNGTSTESVPLVSTTTSDSTTTEDDKTLINLSSNSSSSVAEKRGELDKDSSQQFEIGSSSNNKTVNPPLINLNNSQATPSTSSNRSSSTPLLISNNHSNKIRSVPQREKGARNLFSAESSSQSKDLVSSSIDDVLSKSAGTSTSTGSGSTTGTGQNRGWPMRLLQRTFSSVIKRLVGQQQQGAGSLGSSGKKNSILPSRQQVPAVVPGFTGFPTPTVGDANGLNFLTSALSLAAASISSKPLVDHLDTQVLGGDRHQQIPAASTIQEIGNTLRQHANKKIIDSFIDLPVSERRDTSSERRADSSDASPTDTGSISSSSSNRTGRSSSEWYSDYVADLDEATTNDKQVNDYVDEGPDSGLEPALEYRSMPTYYRSFSDVYEDAVDPLDAAESAIGESDEATPQYLLYSPDSAMLSTRNADGSLTAIRRLNLMNNHRRTQVVDADEPDAAEDRRISLRRRRKPRPPGGLVGSLRPSALLGGHVPSISLQSARARVSSTTTTTTTTTTTKKPSILSPVVTSTTNPDASNDASSMLSPMSSSIHVMDLDPSQTQLAHNKLIVAKFKPKKFMHPTVRKPMDQLTTSATRRSRPSSVSVTSSSHSRPQQASAKESTTMSLASTLLGSQAMSDSHIKDVIDRWTKLGHNSSSGSNHRTNYETLGARSGVNFRPKPQTIELHSEAWANATGNTRSNYSLLAINNRERINPHLFPLDQQSQSGSQQTRVGGLSNRRPTSSKPKLSTTTTTTTSTTTTSTRRPHSVLSINGTAEDESLYGQTLRNQHHLNRTPKPPPVANRVKLSPEAERLRNQFLSLTGGLLGGRNGISSNHSTLQDPVPLSGHITLVPGEDAALEANKYVTLSENGSFTSTMNEATSVPVEHSILVLKDNHNQSARVAPLQFQANKYLDELVNGSRIRPSSAIKLSAGTVSADYAPASPSSVSGVKSSVVTLNTNHSPQFSGNYLHPDALLHRRFGAPVSSTNGFIVTHGKPPQKNYPANKRVMGGAPRSELADSKSSLDMHANDLLRDVFDRDPSYSSSFYGTNSDRLASRSQDGDRFDMPRGVTERQADGGSTGVTNSYEDDRTSGYTGDGLQTSSSISVNVADYQGETTESSMASSPSQFSNGITADYSEQSEVNSAGGDSAMQGHRASLKKHQAAIEAILQAIAAKRSSSSQVTSDNAAPMFTDEPSLDNSLEDTKAPPVDTSLATMFPAEEQASTSPSEEVQPSPVTPTLSAETKRLYSEVGETPLPTTSRFPISVETVSGQRQKINKPVTPAMSAIGGFSTASTVPYTNKLTESPSNDPNLRQTIKNRIHTSTPIYVPTSTLAPLSDSDDQYLGSVDQPHHMGHVVVNEPANEVDAYPTMDLDLPPPKPIRPVIIRRRPVEPQYLVLEERPQVVPGGSIHKRRKRPTRRPLPITPNSISLTELLDSQAMSVDNGTTHLITVALNADGKPKRRRPIPIMLERPAIIRKRPNYPRRPQVAGVPNSIRITTQQETSESSGRHKTPVQIVLPVHGLMERPAQDIRTRPLTIIDPATESPEDLNDPLLTRIPETTILHNNIMVSYKPGRPKPVSIQASTLGSADQNISSISTTASPSTNSSPGSPLSGDAHSVSIAQPVLTTTRPIVMVTFSGSGNTSSLVDTSTSSHHPQTTLRPSSSLQALKPIHGSTLVESGSMSVLAQATQGNHTRPWYPTISSSINSNHRHNATNSTIGPDFGTSESSVIDPMQGSESSSSSSISGSYSNHNQQQNQNSNVHLGMPFLGGSLSSIVSRPANSHHNNGKPSSPWRTKKRPGSQQDSSNNYNRPLASSVSQVFTSGNGLSGFMENLRSFMSRVRSIVIALMVMFLPPIALAASVANAMSS